MTRWNKKKNLDLLPKLTQEEIENVNTSKTSKEIQLVILRTAYKGESGSDDSIGEFQ